MNPARILDALEELVNRMPDESRTNRLIMYSTVKTLVDELRAAAIGERHGNIRRQLSEFVKYCSCMAGLDGEGHPTDQHRSWASMAIDA